MPEIAYRSTHPDVAAHMTRHREAYESWKTRLAEALVDFGFAGSDVWMRDAKVVGVVHQAGQPIPHGWRRDRSADEFVIVPARRSKPGREYGQVLDKLTQPDPRIQLPGGMPSAAMAKGTMSFLKPGFRRVGDTAYVTWSAELRDGDADRIDPTVWERIKLSEYYAALEAEQETADA